MSCYYELYLLYRIRSFFPVSITRVRTFHNNMVKLKCFHHPRLFKTLFLQLEAPAENVTNETQNVNTFVHDFCMPIRFSDIFHNFVFSFPAIKLIFQHPQFVLKFDPSVFKRRVENSFSVGLHDEFKSVFRVLSAP